MSSRKPDVIELELYRLLDALSEILGWLEEIVSKYLVDPEEEEA